MTKSEQLFERAVKRIPGGVNSPVRSYGAIGEAPRFIEKADKCYIYDVDGNRYVDYIDSWGPMILGHNFPEIRESVIKACENGLSFGCATEIEVEIAEFICEHIPHVDMIRMVNSGTEAVMSAIRAARGFTGKDKIIKFAGCYHGHSDCLLVSAGSGVMASGIPDSAGVPKGCTQDTMTATYNDAASVEALLKQEEGNVAAVIVEAVGANMGVVPPKPGFLKRLRELCDEHNCLLIMDLISPCGPVYQAGTLSGNPVAMAAGFTQLKYLYEHQEIYKELAVKGEKLYGGLKKIVEEKGLPYQVNYDSSLASIFFTDQEVKDYVSAKTSNLDLFAKYFKGMLKRGIHLAPSQFEAMFLSTAHTDEVIDETLEAMRSALGDL